MASRRGIGCLEPNAGQPAACSPVANADAYSRSPRPARTSASTSWARVASKVPAPDPVSSRSAAARPSSDAASRLRPAAASVAAMPWSACARCSRNPISLNRLSASEKRVPASVIAAEPERSKAEIEKSEPLPLQASVRPVVVEHVGPQRDRGCMIACIEGDRAEIHLGHELVPFATEGSGHCRRSARGGCAPVRSRLRPWR